MSVTKTQEKYYSVVQITNVSNKHTILLNHGENYSSMSVTMTLSWYTIDWIVSVLLTNTLAYNKVWISCILLTNTLAYNIKMETI
jgi:hypothetical protein